MLLSNLTGGELAQVIVIQLFLLSIISERITNFIKLNFQTILEKLNLTKIRKETGNFRNRELSEYKEKLRERGVLNWAIFVSFWIAISTKADFFFMVEYGELPINRAWDDSEISFWGCVLTGFFISMGSKFWHDLLDIILYTSNLKRKLADPNIYSIEKIEELDEYIKLTSNEITGFAIDQYREILLSRKNITYITQSRKQFGIMVRDCIVIYLGDSDDSNIPAELPVSLPSGRKIMIPTFIVKNVKSIPRSTVISGNFITNKNTSERGTICCGLTKDGINYLLTCYHVLSGNKGKMDSNDFLIPNTGQEIFINVEGLIRPVGNWYYGRRDQKLDVALVELKDHMQNIYEPLEINNKPTSISEIESSNSIGKKQVTILGDQSPDSKGYIVGFTRKPISIQFDDGVFEMTELIEIADIPNHDNCVTITRPGDSGAIIIDNDNYAIGMVFATNERFTYAIPMETILNTLEMKILTVQT